MQASPETFLKAIAPYREDSVVAVACILTWYWLADLCAQEGLPCVLGHALSMKAIHGGKTKNDKIDSQKIAVLLRGGLLRRRTPLMRNRAELLAHIQNTNSQYNLPELGKKIAYKATRDVELSILKTAKQPNAQTLSLLRTVPGIGEILSFVLLYAIHDITRFPRVQDCLSYCRLVQCTKESAGKRSGPSGTKIGNAHLTWAFSEAAVLFLRANPAGQQSLTTLEKKHGSGKALTRLGQNLGRTVYDMLQRQTAFDMGKFLNGSGSGADEPNASLDNHGRSLRVVLWNACVAASLNA